MSFRSCDRFPRSGERSLRTSYPGELVTVAKVLKEDRSRLFGRRPVPLSLTLPSDRNQGPGAVPATPTTEEW